MKYKKLGNTDLMVREIALGCETQCPFDVSIRDNMKRAESIFGK